jgi:hypothetical protein
MKKPIIIVIVLVILGALVWYFGGKGNTQPSNETTPENSTVSAPISETTKVDAKLSSYKNEELGFSVKYPSTWEIGTAPASVVWVIPSEKAGPNSIKKLESKIVVTSGKCAFPPVTTVKERSTLKNGDYTFNMISMSNSAQGTNYFDRMYSLQRDNICYNFSFSSIYTNPASEGFKGSEATQMSNNNKAIVDAADQAFTGMVKSFAYVVGPAGQDETQVKPAR